MWYTSLYPFAGKFFNYSSRKFKPQALSKTQRGWSTATAQVYWAPVCPPSWQGPLGGITGRSQVKVKLRCSLFCSSLGVHQKAFLFIFNLLLFVGKNALKRLKMFKCSYHWGWLVDIIFEYGFFFWRSCWSAGHRKSTFGERLKTVNWGGSKSPETMSTIMKHVNILRNHRKYSNKPKYRQLICISAAAFSRPANFLPIGARRSDRIGLLVQICDG